MRRLALMLALLSVTSIARADGEQCDAGISYDPGKGCILLCNGKSAMGDCNGGVGISPPSGYQGGGMMIEIPKATGFGATLAVSVFWASTSSGVFKHRIATLDNGNDWAHVVQAGIHFPGYLFATVDNAGGSSDIDVAVHFK